MKIRPAVRIRGQLRVPGDKSISHRAAMIAALADGSSRLANFSTSQDCASTLSCLRSLGVSIDQKGNDVRVDGRGARGLSAPAEPLDCGNSGSTMRMLAGILAGQGFASVLTGDASLLSRPMKRIVEPLELMGARVSSQAGRPPLRIEGLHPLRPIRYELPVASAQVKSCILLAALNANGRSEVIERLGPTRDHTERMLRWFGVPLETHAGADGARAATTAINVPARLSARDVNIPGDMSSAAFLVGAAALLPGSQLEIQSVGLNPTRAQFLSTLDSLGFDVEIAGLREDCNEPVGDLNVTGKTGLRAEQKVSHRVAGPLIPQLIDELPLLAVLGSQVAGGIEIRDAAELRAKETDRIAATVTNLRAMGAEVEEFDDGLAVAGPTALRGARVDSYNDHRIAMAFAVAGLVADGESEISGTDCVAVSFPEFFDLLETVVER
jgi:3-phosphoshikimate 1-carboxyvinyltransferase